MFDELYPFNALILGMKYQLLDFSMCDKHNRNKSQLDPPFAIVIYLNFNYKNYGFVFGCYVLYFCTSPDFGL